MTAVPSALRSSVRMCGSEEPCWGLSAPGPTLLLSLLLSAAPSGLLGEETRQVRGYSNRCFRKWNT